MAITFYSTGTSSGSGSGYLQQVVQTDVQTGDIISIPIEPTTDFKGEYVTNILYFEPGEVGVIQVINSYSNSESINFIPNPFIAFDGTMREKTDYTLTTTTAALGAGKLYTTEIDPTQYKIIESLGVA